ncbi:hypothetical protein [Ensifer sp. SL37]|uniref:hypothetical protein n=1 Tax=Ensifer sp. SL37 TaxID=2995137 RepID=UPI0022741714|nr:hypothetical protein [Ensifer sp. SL37]MCY1740691.1 hypothetical protein [Ensifer sp. SL37]
MIIGEMGENSRYTAKYAEWRRQWWKETLGEDLRESRVLLPAKDYPRAMALASDLGTRLPLLLGQLVVSQLDFLDEAPSPTTVSVPGPPEQSDSDRGADLRRLIFASQFPGDTASTRMRLSAIVDHIASEVARGCRPTARQITNLLNAPSNQVDALCRLLEARGMLDRTRTPGVSPGKSAKVLSIREDAADRLQAAHHAATGRVITLDD